MNTHIHTTAHTRTHTHTHTHIGLLIAADVSLSTPSAQGNPNETDDKGIKFRAGYNGNAHTRYTRSRSSLVRTFSSHAQTHAAERTYAAT
jgi:hypothetical protein